VEPQALGWDGTNSYGAGRETSLWSASGDYKRNAWISYENIDVSLEINVEKIRAKGDWSRASFREDIEQIVAGANLDCSGYFVAGPFGKDVLDQHESVCAGYKSAASEPQSQARTGEKYLRILQSPRLISGVPNGVPKLPVEITWRDFLSVETTVSDWDCSRRRLAEDLQNLYASVRFRPAPPAFDSPILNVLLPFHPRIEPIPEREHPLIVVLPHSPVEGVSRLDKIAGT